MSISSECCLASMTRAASRTMVLALPLLAMLLGGCTVAEKSYRFHANSIKRISYDPKNCVELPDGTFRCKDVIFTVNSIEAFNKH